MAKNNRYIDAYQQFPDKPAKVLVALYKGNYLRLLMSGLTYLVKHSPTWVMPVMVAQIITALNGQGPVAETWHLVLRNSAIVGGLVLLNIPMNYLHVHFRGTALRNVEAGLRSTIVEKLQQLSIPFHNEMQSGKLQSKMIRDVEAVQTLSEQVFVNLLNISINIIVSLAITASTNWTIFAFFLLTIPVAALTIRLFRKPIEKKNKTFRQEVERTSADFVEMEDMITITRAHGLEDVEMERMARQAKMVSDEGYRLDIVQANFGSVSWAVFQFFQLFTLMFSSFLVLRNRIPVGNVVMYQTYFTTLVNQVTALITLVPMIAKGFESVRSIGEVLTSMDVEDYTDKTWLPEVKGDIRFENVNFAYRNQTKTVLQNFNLEVKAGQTVAFVGESGAGKSTIINLIIGFMKPVSGHLWIDGVDSEELNFRSFRRQLAVVPQNSILFSGTLRENISYGFRDIPDEKIWEAVDAAALTDFIRGLPDGLDTVIQENGGNLSGGQKQRIAIARALVRDPQVIIFDEATSALDSISEQAVLQALNRLIEGRTAFIVAHRISTIRQADKICVLDKGKLVEEGSYNELMEKKGQFYQMQQIQSGSDFEEESNA